eukprot:PhF_6_TR9741/c0_g1_i1/m.15007
MISPPSDPSTLLNNVPFESLRFRTIIEKQSQSVVYYEKVSGVHCAIKVVSNEHLTERVENEIRILQILQLNGIPSIPRFFTSSRGGETTAFLMTYIPGCTIDRLFIEFKSLKVPTAVDIIAQLIIIFEKMHSLRVVHNDLKANNVMVNHLGRCSVVDFDLSMNLNDPKIGGGSNQRIGTRHMRAPETIMAPQLLPTTKVDVWAIGILLFEMVMGKPPFGLREDDIEDKIRLGVAGQNIFVDTLWPSNPLCRDFISQCLSQDPVNRPECSQLRRHPLLDQVNWTQLEALLRGDADTVGLPSFDMYYEEIEMQCLGRYFSDSLHWV